VDPVGLDLMPATASRLHPALPGLGAAAAAALVAWAVHALVPAIPLLTVAVALGIAAAQVPAARPALTGPLKPGLALASKRLMRIGVVLLGLQLGLSDIVGLGWRAVLLVVAVVALSFAGTYAIARALRMPGQQPLLLATGFSICGASAIGAMAGVTRAKPADQGAPVALVTLCGTLAIAVLPPLAGPLGLDDVAFGHWVGAGVHDVGQVVATAQIAGSAALTIAIAVKLTRVLLLAPVVAVAGVVMRRRECWCARSSRCPTACSTRRRSCRRRSSRSRSWRSDPRCASASSWARADPRSPPASCPGRSSRASRSRPCACLDPPPPTAPPASRRVTSRPGNRREPGLA
jgi:uncharacterized integral membrane protein (TIGR00698 family)